MDDLDFEAERRIALRILEAAKLLVAYLETAPAAPRRLSEQLMDLFSELWHPALAGNTSSTARDVAEQMSNWIALCVAAVERPDLLEMDEP